MEYSCTVHVCACTSACSVPTDKNISIDKVIQQLQELAPHWRVLGEAAHIQPAILENVSATLTCIPT